jgi:PleD family two-component response regulator
LLKVLGGIRGAGPSAERHFGTLGEESLVFSPDVAAVAVGDLAERCRVPIPQSSVAEGSTRASVTASTGAKVLIHSDCAEPLIGRVDELMYQSKHCGGDRTIQGIDNT